MVQVIRSTVVERIFSSKALPLDNPSILRLNVNSHSSPIYPETPSAWVLNIEFPLVQKPGSPLPNPWVILLPPTHPAVRSRSLSVLLSSHWVDRWEGCTLDDGTTSGKLTPTFLSVEFPRGSDWNIDRKPQISFNREYIAHE